MKAEITLKWWQIYSIVIGLVLPSTGVTQLYHLSNSVIINPYVKRIKQRKQRSNE